MRSAHATSRLQFLAPALYLVAIAALLTAQFAGRRTRVTSSGDLVVSATTIRSLFGEERLWAIEVRFGVLRLRLSPASPATLVDGSGITERLRPLRHRFTADSVSVSLRESLDLIVTAREGLLEARVSTDGSSPPGVELSLPIDFTPGARPSAVPGLPMLAVEGDGAATFVWALSAAELDGHAVRGRLSAEGTTALLRARRRAPDADAYAEWFGLPTEETARAAYDDGVAAYLAASFASWVGRISAGAADPVSEPLLTTAFLTESAAWGSLAQAVGLVQPGLALALMQGMRPVDARPAVWTGMLQSHLDALRAERAAVAEEIARGAARGDTGLFSKPRELAAALHDGPETLGSDLAALAASLRPEAAEPGTLLDAARFLAEAAPSLPADGRVQSTLERLLTLGVIPHLKPTDRGILYLPEPGSAEGTERTIAAGRLLIASAELLHRPVLETLGRECIRSALTLAAADGSLPASVRLDGARLLGTSARLRPEEVYELVAADRHYPRERPLPRGLGAGAWILTAASVSDVAFEGGALRAVLGMPAGRTHYLAVHGPESVAWVELHGIVWRPDPDYYRYSDGWWYDAATRTLYVKCTQQRDVEPLVVALR